MRSTPAERRRGIHPFQISYISNFVTAKLLLVLNEDTSITGSTNQSEKFYTTRKI